MCLFILPGNNADKTQKNYLYLKSIRKLVEKGKIDITTSPFPDWVQALQYKVAGLNYYYGC
jgi:hypothetical protein